MDKQAELRKEFEDIRKQPATYFTHDEITGVEVIASLDHTFIGCIVTIVQ